MIRVGGLVVIGIVAINTNGRSPGITVGVAIGTVGGNMGTCQREVRLAMVETVFAFAGGMAVKAGLADIYVTADFIVLLIRILLVMLMAGDAVEFRIISRVRMAIGTAVPRTVM